MTIGLFRKEVQRDECMHQLEITASSLQEFGKDMKTTLDNKGIVFNYDATILLSLAYLLYGMLRKTVPVATPLLIQDMEFTKADLGLISASFGVGFGLSKLTGGFVCDVYSCRKILSLGLFIASVSSIAFLFIPSEMRFYFRLVWFWHGFAQGVGWPAIASLICDNFDVVGRSTMWSLISSAGNVGSILVPVLFIPLMEQYDWQVTFLAIGVSGIVGSFLVLLGPLKAPSVLTTEAHNLSGKDDDSPQSEEELSKSNFLSNASFWFLIVSNAITSFLMTSVADWLGQYLIEVCQLVHKGQLQQILFANEIGGFLGTLSSGILCDQIFHGRSDLCCFCFSLLFIPAIYFLPTSVIEFLPSDTSTPLSPYLTTLLSATLLGVAINGPKTLSGMALRSMLPTTSFGFGGGLLGVFAQIGVFCSGTGVGWLLQHHQWTHFVTVLLVASCISSGLMLLMVVSVSRSASRWTNNTTEKVKAS